MSKNWRKRYLGLCGLGRYDVIMEGRSVNGPLCYCPNSAPSITNSELTTLNGTWRSTVEKEKPALAESILDNP